ncbi:hypothetical protein JJB11_04540 [Ramlibacter ginsenosidimutans]|uniref:Uncharacterized protein n=1 Tax=Ramlibacter ginsenosidimutans TaxID=502333 RepID=A0A934TQC5_9BURK|nr:hypothetical protein [Ramlibacter ginsenosidimutans]MBK6005353.1 hypothetical protein [Ramlibacter ginsenosidimutans]
MNGSMGRLIEIVKERGISAFTYDDVKFVSKPLFANPERLILVGGQALEVWGVLLKVPPPTGVALTEDTDWLGSKDDAKWLIESLGPIASDLQIPDVTDPTPSSALAFIQRQEERILMMDFMKTIVGPDEHAIRKLAVQVTLMDDVKLAILHPLHCLESRLGNLTSIPSKRGGNGPMQAKWAMDIAREFILGMVRSGQPADEVQKACKMVSGLVESKQKRHYARYCHIHYGINPLDAVPAEAVQYVGGGFENDEWPRVIERVTHKLASWREIAARTQPQLKSSGSKVT